MDFGDAQQAEVSVEDIDRAQQMVKAVRPESCTKDELMKVYKDWSQNNSYEKDIGFSHPAPGICAESASQYLSGHPEALILDIGAGTGLLGAELFKRGFTNVEALDPSDDMMSLAANKKVYKKMHVTYFTDDMASFKTNTYDAIVTSAALGGCHIEYQALKEFIRIVKPGGYVIIATYIGLIETDKEIVEELKRLEEEGLWRQLESRVINNYWLEEKGLLFVFKITKSK